MAVIHRALCTWFVVQIFLILLVLRLDERTRWSWFIVFIPIWLHDAVMFMSIIVKMVTSCKNAPERTRRALARYGWCLLIVLLKLTSQIMLCIKLEYPGSSLDISLYYIMLPVWVFLPLTITDLVRAMHHRSV